MKGYVYRLYKGGQEIGELTLKAEDALDAEARAAEVVKDKIGLFFDTVARDKYDTLNNMNMDILKGYEILRKEADEARKNADFYRGEAEFWVGQYKQIAGKVFSSHDDS